MTQSSYETDDVRGELRDVLYRVLIDKIRQDKYPSVTMMDMVEGGLDENRLREYVDVLLDKVEGDQYPSMDMLKRLQSLL